MKRTLNYKLAAIALAVAGSSAVQVQGQSADALIDKLVDKGILTVKEANDLREETDKNFTQAYSVKSGMPDWVNALKLNGDFRMRYDAFYSSAQVERNGGLDKFTDRVRYRYRVRFGATVSMFDHLEAGLRLTSSDAARGDSSFGGNPISANTTLRDNGSKKLIFVDQAYGKWYGLNGPSLSGNLAVGKMENPFTVDDMVIDPDYTPEGAATQLAYQLNDRHALKVNGGIFVLDELSGSGLDPFLWGSQLRWDATWSKKISTSIGATYLSIEHAEQLTTAAVPDQAAGNTRDAASALVYDYNPIVVDASTTYTLESFPLYTGAFPIKLGGVYMHNPGAPSSADNYGWSTGVTFGKSGKRGTWEIGYFYRWLGSDAWYEELEDSDFGALYQRSSAGNGAGPSITAGSGYSSGPNAKGHSFRVRYSPTDALTLSARYILTETIRQPASTPVNVNGELTRLQIDASLRF